MKKSLIKGFSMLTLIVVIALASAVVSANAQTATKLVTADIPFDFVVADKSLPSGEYRVTAASGENGLLIRSVDGKHSAIRLSNGIDPKNDRTDSRLVFHRYGNRYFLAEVWDGDNSGRQLIKSKQERAMERELAAIQSKSEFAESTYAIVEVLAKAR